MSHFDTADGIVIHGGDSATEIQSTSPQCWSDPADLVDSDLPRGLLPLRQRSHSSYYLTITDIVADTDIRLGRDGLRFMLERPAAYDAVDQTAPPRVSPDADEHRPIDYQLDQMVICSRVKNVDKMTTKDTAVNTILNNRKETARVYIPSRILSAIGLDLEGYPTGDPFLFEPVYQSGDEMFGLDPLGNASAICRTDPAYELPIRRVHIVRVAGALDLTISTVQDRIDKFSRTITPQTFSAADISTVADPMFVEKGDDRYGIYFYPLGAIQEIAARFYDFEPREARAVWDIYSEAIGQLLHEIYDQHPNEDPIPEDHPLQDPQTEAVLIPIATADQ